VIIRKTPSSRPIDRPEEAGRAERLLALALRGLALALLVSMLAAALHDASQAWDVGYYHLPFAGRLAGILPASEYVFSTPNMGRFRGFCLLGELLQGALWRVTGRPESVNLVAYSSVPILGWFGARRLRVPWHLTVLSLLAIPLVHAHATSAYVDLPANAAASVLVMVTLEAYVSERPVSVRDALLAALSATFAANMKPMMQPVVALALALLAIRLYASRGRTGERGTKESRRALGLLLAALPFVFATPLKNLALYGNPYFPIRITLLGRTLAGTEDAYSSSPGWLEHAPRPVRFVCSLLELGIRPMSDPRRWTIDQWMRSDAPGYRMGGFFHAYVVAHVGVFLWRVIVAPTRATRTAAVGFAGFTLALSLMPQSHELRYYMAWMIVLVLSNLWLAARPHSMEGGSTSTPKLGVLAGMAVTALAVVLVVTHGVYAYPSGSSFYELVRAKVDQRLIAGIAKGERVCVNREPFDVLWAPAFHGERSYVLKEAEEASDCKGYRPLE
jgi:hypothetical protein